MRPQTFEKLRASLAANLRARRMEIGLSQERLALEADIDRTFVSQIERGVGNPSLRILCQLATQLGIEVSALLEPAARRK